MKTKLSFLFILLTIFTYGQTPISNFDSAPMTVYAVVTSSGAVDQTASGTALTWNFTDLVADGTTTTDTYAAPTPVEITNYPGTTSVLTITDNSMAANKIFSQNTSNNISFTGAERDDLILSYTNNAFIGIFPMSYNVSNSDPVSGAFTYSNTPLGAVSGTFAGTINSSVDAYGTLNMNDLGEGAYSGNVTRLKIVQNLTLNATSPFPVTAEATQTSYFYYDNSTNNLVFRTNSFVVALLSVNETIMESFLPESTLNIKANEVALNELKIVPNPAGDLLNIQFNKNEIINSIIITDMSGRQVLSIKNSLNSISVSELKSGMYIANITTDSGVYSKKFIKK
ncbi:T9SS type A sorting domain-containing protein [Xanthomarina sp. F2636L]|uniref:T9SS type A sorting domain-containing protein n=1 Tax=Xanthomarina sp. F2636L TaxID=2996018 RepID=UPI00225E3D79|nr:T9SS type A sorting domain-containing protein [Xanthomarina sp. F2636L]MCX7550498.1 T9SS type A sorting domain-containing protein [Xanthomarina sp. F2636L]